MKKKKNVKHSPKDGPIATHHQAFEEPTDQPPLLPRPFSSILPEHCGTRIVVHQKEKKVAFLFVHARWSAEEDRDGSWRRWTKLLPFSGTHCSSGAPAARTIDSSAVRASGFSKSRARERATTSEGRRRLAGNRRPPRRISSLWSHVLDSTGETRAGRRRGREEHVGARRRDAYTDARSV